MGEINMRRFTFQNKHGVVRSVVAESVALARTMLPWSSQPVSSASLLPRPDKWTLVATEPV
jgi:hypothetical protein